MLLVKTGAVPVVFLPRRGRRRRGCRKRGSIASTAPPTVISLEGMHYYFIAYDHDTNAIIPKPITDLKDETIIKVFEEVFNIGLLYIDKAEREISHCH